MNKADISTMVEAITPEIYKSFKEAVELRKWRNGVALTPEQIDTCLQAIIAYEYRNLPEHERTGYIPPKTEPCADDSHIHTRETPIKWKD